MYNLYVIVHYNTQLVSLQMNLKTDNVTLTMNAQAEMLTDRSLYKII